MTTPVLIATLARNSREEVRIGLTLYQGRRLVDVRVYAPFAGPAGQMAPTGKGVSLSVDQLPALASALAEAEAKARTIGWLGDQP